MKNIFKTTLILITTALLCSCTRAQDPQALYKKANTEFQNKDYVSAEKTIVELENLTPHNYQVTCLHGMIKGSAGAPFEAMDYFSKAIEISAKNPTAYGFLGDTYKTVNMWVQAREYYKKALSLCLDAQCTGAFTSAIKNLDETQARASAGQTQSFVKMRGGKYEVPAFDGRKWKLANAGAGANLVQLEFVLEDESINNWSEIITHMFLPKGHYEQGIDNFIKKTSKISKSLGKDLGRQYYEKIISKTQEQVVYTWGYGDGYENNLFIITQSKEGLFQMSYAKKSPFTDAEIKKWVSILNE